ncbi:hypothetical protein FE236_10465 [Mariprofundus erugo]|uniref:hypothetical protein n=1 Tax=Mariprofundus erugo TaxID=2528639 RepID=UPI0010FEEAB7|nr:hypothetical protein [Mariprofundus erugo]TLS74932.1 hypothetical protein FE236_10465 [Mariprofundus erugo]
MSHADGAVRHASGWQLLALFVTALLLFVVWRWQPEPWLRSTIAESLRPYHMTLEYQKLETAGLAIRLEGVRISSDSLPLPLQLDSIRLAPDWLSLLQLRPAAHLTLLWNGVDVQATLSRSDQAIELADMHASAAAEALSAQFSGMLPVQPGGELQLSGTLQIDPVSGRPLNGSLQGIWQQASLLFPGAKESLGNYTLALKHDGQGNSWQWQLTGGTAVVLHGTGTLAIPSNLPQQWQLAGDVGIVAGASVSATLQSMLQQPLRFSLAGSLMAPRLQLQR